jgi:hypothetical protein
LVFAIIWLVLFGALFGLNLEKIVAFVLGIGSGKKRWALVWLLITPPFSNKYPLQRDIFCINEASLLCVPFGLSVELCSLGLVELCSKGWPERGGLLGLIWDWS